jgi:uncharacterized membrane protein YdbT with pleckstrin-like domain
MFIRKKPASGRMPNVACGTQALPGEKFPGSGIPPAFPLELQRKWDIIAAMDEETLWQGARSQITNLGVYSLALVALAAAAVGGFFMPPVWALMAAPVLWIAWIWISTKAESFTLTTERLRIKKGVFNQTFDEVELYRVKDITLTRSMLQRMLGLGSVVMQTSDRGQENINISSVRQSEELREHLRQQVELIRDRKRVREVDFQEDSHPHAHEA